jgi:D-alanyl-lipoteichoic acid acyltransferase DltB (MBOAT superfamily)
MLLAASCVFYSYFVPIYILILFFTIIIDYIAGIQIEKAQGPRRKLFLVMSLVANIGILAVFKYYNFIIDNLNFVTDAVGLQNSHLPYLGILLPIGLSFHTFQAMSYTIEVYRGNYPAERNFGIYSLYVMFYPQLVAGPIERPQNVLYQFYEKHEFDFVQVVTGIQRILWGLFKKVVVSDLLGTYVNSIYNSHEQHTGFTLLFATYAFAFQIYCDFSGYSDMALGTAQTMGFRLMENFHLPYFSKSITEFWRRWHISLSTWLRDYLYISLGGNRNGKFMQYRNQMLTMVIGGLWHGASWNFVIWGFLNGLYLGIEKWLGVNVKEDARRPFLVRVGKAFLVFNLICLTWVFFRATTFAQAFGIIKGIFVTPNFFNLDIQDTGIFSSMLVGVLILLGVEFFFLRKHRIEDVTPAAGWLKPLAMATCLVLLILVFGVSEGDQFIYFQF